MTVMLQMSPVRFARYEEWQIQKDYPREKFVKDYFPLQKKYKLGHNMGWMTFALPNALKDNKVAVFTDLDLLEFLNFLINESIFGTENYFDTTDLKIYDLNKKPVGKNFNPERRRVEHFLKRLNDKNLPQRELTDLITKFKLECYDYNNYEGLIPVEHELRKMRAYTNDKYVPYAQQVVDCRRFLSDEQYEQSYQSPTGQAYIQKTLDEIKQLNRERQGFLPAVVSQLLEKYFPWFKKDN